MATPNTKIVNIKATIPIRDTTPPIYGVKTNVKMTHSDILKCLCRRAIVEEVLPDGSTVRLNTKNFRDNLAASVKPVEKPVVKKETEKAKEVDLIDKITEDADDDDQNEPEEAKNVNTTLKFVDGVVIHTTGVKAEIIDDEDETHVSNDEETEEDIESIINEATYDQVEEKEEITEENAEEETPVVNTISEPVDTSVRKRTSSKKNSKKK